MRFDVLNGPNLNLLGVREPGHYGARTLADVEASLHAVAGELGVEVHTRQSNHEGVLIDYLHTLPAAGCLGLVFNPGGYTHTSVALRDALLAVAVPFVEVHVSNVYAREPFRHTSLFRDIASGVMTGLGTDGYEWALRHLVRQARSRP